MKIVSVIVPVKNEQKHIEKCVESLIKINYPSLEIIIVDDNSTDKTIEILNNYAKNGKIR